MVIRCACALIQKPLRGTAVDMYTEDHTELNTPQIGQRFGYASKCSNYHIGITLCLSCL